MAIGKSGKIIKILWSISGNSNKIKLKLSLYCKFEMFPTRWSSDKLIFCSLGCLKLELPTFKKKKVGTSCCNFSQHFLVHGRPSLIHLFSSFWCVMCRFYCFGVQISFTVASTGLLDRWMYRLVEVLTTPNARSAMRWELGLQ